MQDRDFSKYYVAEDDGMIWLESSKDLDGTTPVFPTQEAFIDALAQSKDEHKGMGYLESIKLGIYGCAKSLAEKYKGKTDEELKEYFDSLQEDDDTYADVENDMMNIMLIYQQYLMISKENMSVYNDVIDEYVQDYPWFSKGEQVDMSFDTLDNKSDKHYWYLHISEEILSHETIKLLLTDEEIAKYTTLEDYTDINKYDFLASVRLARKVVNNPYEVKIVTIPIFDKLPDPSTVPDGFICRLSE